MHCRYWSHAIDLGVDTTGGGPRRAVKLRSRAKSNVARADRGRVISKTLKQIGATHKQVKKAATLSRVGMDKSQVYGSPAVG